MRVKPADFFIVIVSAVVIILSIALIRHAGGGKPVLIINSPDAKYVYPMDKDRTVTIKGAIGNSIIEIKDGEARFLDSPCPNKVCVKSGTISKDSEWEACLPNQIFIRVESKNESNKLDAAAY